MNSIGFFFFFFFHLRMSLFQLFSWRIFLIAIESRINSSLLSRSVAYNNNRLLYCLPASIISIEIHCHLNHSPIGNVLEFLPSVFKIFFFIFVFQKFDYDVTTCPFWGFSQTLKSVHLWLSPNVRIFQLHFFSATISFSTPFRILVT